MMITIRCLLAFAVCAALALVSASAADAQVTTTTTAAPAVVQTDPSICASAYIPGLRFDNATLQTWVLFSISACTRRAITATPGGAVCGDGFAGWTEGAAPMNASCQYLYTANTSTGIATQTSYTNGTYVLVVNWRCTGLATELDPARSEVTAVSGNRDRREVWLTTKACVQRNDDLKAGVIVAIVVVAIFLLVVIVSVVKAKCFGSGGTGGAGSASGDTVHNGYTAA